MIIEKSGTIKLQVYKDSSFCGFKWKNIKSTIKYDDNSERNVNRSTKREKNEFIKAQRESNKKWINKDILSY